jgi:hypothetical protein
MQTAEWSVEKLGDWTQPCDDADCGVVCGEAGRLDLDLPIEVPGLVGAQSYTRGAWSQLGRKCDRGEGSVCGLCTPPTGSSA